MLQKIAVILFCLFLVCAPMCQAANPGTSYQDLEDDLLGDDFIESLPNDIQDKLDDYELTPSQDSVTSYLDFGTIIDFLSGGILSAFRGTAREFAMILGIVLIFALLSIFRNSIKSEHLTYAFGISAAAAIALTLYSSIQGGYQTAVLAITDMNMLTKTALPLMATAMASSGAPAAASTMSATMLIGIDALSTLNTTVLLPMLNVYLGLSIASSINSNLKISGITKFLKNMMIWGMCLVSTLFTGILSFQKLIAASSDTITTKSVKFAFSSAIPIVGSSLEGALSTVFSCVSMIKNTLGIFAVIAILIMTLPSILQAGAYMLMLSLSAGISEIAGEENISQLLKSLSGVWSILLAVTATQVLAVIISLTLLLGVSG